METSPQVTVLILFSTKSRKSLRSFEVQRKWWCPWRFLGDWQDWTLTSTMRPTTPTMPRFPAGNGPPDFQGLWTTCLSRFINHHCTLQFLRWSEDSSVFFLWGDLWIVKMKVKTSQLTLACIYKYIIIYIYFYVNIYTCWIYPPPRMQSWQMSRSRLESSTKTCNNPGGWVLLERGPTQYTYTWLIFHVL